MVQTAASILGSADIPELHEAISPVRPESVTVYPASVLMMRVWNRGTAAMTVGSRVFMKPDLLETSGPAIEDLIVHELVHVRQWKDQRTAGFLASYFRQYLMARMFGAPHHVAYMSIDAEVEARRIAGAIRQLLDD
jgi:Domain of unknown function (DUF4157)